MKDDLVYLRHIDEAITRSLTDAKYVCGTRGELPTGQSITYSFTGTR